MDALKIETNAVDKLKSVLCRCDKILADISTNDKTPSFDGTIFMYNSTELNKRNIRGFIQIQVKGKVVKSKDFKKNSISYSMDVADLHNFRKVGGVILFVVCMSDVDNYKIYYNALLPFDLEQIMVKAKGQKTKSIKLDEFPSKNEEFIMLIFGNFINNSIKQQSTAQVTTIEDLKKYDNLTFSAKADFHYMFKIPTYIYGKNRNDIDIGIPLSKVLIEAVSSENLPASVTIDDKVYFDKISIEKTINSTSIKIGTGFTINVEKGKINYNLSGNLNDRIKNLEFLIGLVSGKILKIGNLFKSESVSLKGFNLQDAHQVLAFYKRLQNLMYVLNIIEPFDMDKVSDDDLKNLEIFDKAIIEGLAVCLKNNEYKHSLVRFRVANLVIGAIARRNHEGEYIINNLFDKHNEQCSISYDGIEHIVCTIYVVLKKEDFIELSNINYKNMREAIVSIPYTEKYGQVVNILILEMLLAYDENKNDELLNLISA